MKILSERMDKNFPTVPVSKSGVDIAIERAVTKGIVNIVNEILTNTQNEAMTAEDLLFSPEGNELKTTLKSKLMELFGQE